MSILTVDIPLHRPFLPLSNDHTFLVAFLLISGYVAVYFDFMARMFPTST